MISKSPRSIFTAFAAVALSAFAVSARADSGDAQQTSLTLEDHVVDAKVQDIIKNSKSPADAVRAMRQLVMQDPNNAELWYQVGEACYAVHDTEKAVSAYRKCVALDPKRKDAWNTIAIIYYTAGDTNDALQTLNSGLVANPQDLQEFNTYAVILVETGRLDDATALLNKMKSINPDYPQAWSTTGELLFKRQRWQDALDAYDKALALDPKDYKALLNHGLSHWNLKDFPAAIADLQKVTQIAPTYSTGWLGLMQLYLKNGQTAEAVKTGHAAVAQIPDAPLLWKGLGESLTAAGDGKGALDALHTAQKLKPDLKLDDAFAAARKLAGPSDIQGN